MLEKSALETLYGGQFMMSSQLIKPDYLQLILGKMSVYQILHGKSVHMVLTQEKIEINSELGASDISDRNQQA